MGSGFSKTKAKQQNRLNVYKKTYSRQCSAYKNGTNPTTFSLAKTESRKSENTGTQAITEIVTQSKEKSLEVCPKVAEAGDSVSVAGPLALLSEATEITQSESDMTKLNCFLLADMATATSLQRRICRADKERSVSNSTLTSDDCISSGVPETAAAPPLNAEATSNADTTPNEKTPNSETTPTPENKTPIAEVSNPEEPEVPKRATQSTENVADKDLEAPVAKNVSGDSLLDKLQPRRDRDLYEWRPIAAKQQVDLDRKKTSNSSLGEKHASTVPRLPPLFPVALPAVTNLRGRSFSDEDDFLDSLDWNISAEDDDFVGNGAKKYLGYAAMEKVAKKIKQEEDSLLARTRPKIHLKTKKTKAKTKVGEIAKDSAVPIFLSKKIEEIKDEVANPVDLDHVLLSPSCGDNASVDPQGDDSKEAAASVAAAAVVSAVTDAAVKHIEEDTHRITEMLSHINCAEKVILDLDLI